MNNQNYHDMVLDVINKLDGDMIKIGQKWVKQLPAPVKPPELKEITLRFPDGDSRQGIKIIYRRNDAYILGYCTVGGKNYAFRDQIANIPNSVDLTFDSDYQTLGWDRSHDHCPLMNVSLLDEALYFVANGFAGKEFLLKIVLALGEGVRFIDVEAAVRSGCEITSTMTDWDQQLVAGNAVLKQGQTV